MHIRSPSRPDGPSKATLRDIHMEAAPMQDITAATRDEALVPAPPKTSQPRNRWFGVAAFVVGALGMGLAGGANLHRLVDLNQIGSILQSGLEVARREIGSRIESFMSRPISVAQASHEATSSATPNNDI